MKYSMNRSFEEHLADLIADAKLSTIDEMVVMDAFSDHECNELISANNEIEQLQSEVGELKNPPEPNGDESLSLDEDGAVVRAETETDLGVFGDIEDYETSFVFTIDEYAVQKGNKFEIKLSGADIDQLARLKQIWVNQ